MQSWKKKQTKKKKSKFLSRIQISVMAVVMLVVFVRLIMLFDWFGKVPQVLGESILNQSLTGYKWTGQSQFNIFVNPNWVVGFDPETKVLRYFQLSELKSVDLLQVELKKAKIYVDGVLSFDTELVELDELPDRLFGALVFGTGLKTNLTRWQLLALWWDIRGAGIPQESETFNLTEDEILAESMQISIYNGTHIAGLAQEMAIWAENLGAKVVEVRNADTRFNQTYIEAFNSSRQTRTLERLRQVFDAEVVFNETDQPQREDIRIVIGEDAIR